MNSSFRTIIIEEQWVKRDGRVYWRYRFRDNARWTYKLTPYTKLPYVKLNLTKNLKGEAK